jgi:hypothetical protein
MLTARERIGVRRMLRKEGYDTRNEDLMANEAQAYLIHTADPNYFRPVMFGMSVPRAAVLRSVFIEHIPEPWLRLSALSEATPALSVSVRTVSTAAPSPQAKPRSHVHHGGVPWRTQRLALP